MGKQNDASSRYPAQSEGEPSGKRGKESAAGKSRSRKTTASKATAGKSVKKATPKNAEALKKKPAATTSPRKKAAGPKAVPKKAAAKPSTGTSGTRQRKSADEPAPQAPAGRKPGKQEAGKTRPRGTIRRVKKAPVKTVRGSVPKKQRPWPMPEGEPARGATEEAAAPATLPTSRWPRQYDTTRLVLLQRDAEWLYAYWEISREDWRRHRIGQPQGAGPLLLRVMELNEQGQPKHQGHRLYITVAPAVGQWFVHLPIPDRSWQAALGYIGREGRYHAICESNASISPRQSPARWDEDEQWRPSTEAAGEIIQQLSMGMEPAGLERLQHLARAELAAGAQPPAYDPADNPEPPDGHTPTGRQWIVGGGTTLREAMSHLHGRSGDRPAPGPSRAEGLMTERPMDETAPEVPGSPMMLETPGLEWKAPASEQMGADRREAAEGFPFWVEAELILYGGTEPDAKVRLRGHPVRLREDGTFTLRMRLPNGLHELPFEAEKENGEDGQRRVWLEISRETHHKE